MTKFKLEILMSDFHKVIYRFAVQYLTFENSKGKVLCVIMLFHDFRDTYIICLVDTLTSIFAGFVIFAILGVMANKANVKVTDVTEARESSLTSREFLYLIL